MRWFWRRPLAANAWAATRRLGRGLTRLFGRLFERRCLRERARRSRGRRSRGHRSRGRPDTEISRLRRLSRLLVQLVLQTRPSVLEPHLDLTRGHVELLAQLARLLVGRVLLPVKGLEEDLLFLVICESVARVEGAIGCRIHGRGGLLALSGGTRRIDACRCRTRSIVRLVSPQTWPRTRKGALGELLGRGRPLALGQVVEVLRLARKHPLRLGALRRCLRGWRCRCWVSGRISCGGRGECVGLDGHGVWCGHHGHVGGIVGTGRDEGQLVQVIREGLEGTELVGRRAVKEVEAAAAHGGDGLCAAQLRLERTRRFSREACNRQ